MRSLLIIAIVLLAIVACTTKKEYIKYSTFSYNETSCADKWQRSSNDSITKRNIIHYLDSLQVYVADVTIKQENAGQACLACTCLTGRVIYVTSFEGMQSRYLQIGFK